ncbi:MAG: LysM peptidoglycan-binding domain-containing protein [Cytophagales bacterium]|nr:LysM peptidoglycan-binding domain-containing protein [Cytophagales bacterium]
MKKFLVLGVLMCLTNVLVWAGVQDSTGVQKANDGTTIILHKVEKGQTYWSLYTRYKKHGATVKKIQQANGNASLQTGKIVKIPTTLKAQRGSSSTNSSSARSSNKIHIVQSGETLYKISTKYGVSVSNIKKWNNLKSNSLNKGQKLIVGKGTNNTTSSTTVNSSASSSNKVHTVQSGETLYKISTKYGVSVSNIKKWNNLKSNSLNKGQKLIVGKGGANNSTTSQTSQATQKQITHKVKSGETLYGIARKYNVSVATLKKKNPNIEKGLSVGAILIIKEGTTDGSSHQQIGATNEKHKKIYTGYEKVVQEGTSTLTMKTGFDENFSYVFHATIPYGVIVTVINPLTGEYTYARVIGKIPEGSSNIIEVSKTVWETLKLSGKRPPIKISYVL